MISQDCLTNLKLNPSGPGALFDSHEDTALSISSLEKDRINASTCSGETQLKSRPSKVGLFEDSSLKIFLKNADASFLM